MARLRFFILSISFVVSGFLSAQDPVPDNVLRCRGTESECLCLDSLYRFSSDADERAHALFYSVLTDCDPDISVQKNTLYQCRKLWDEINYAGHRYIHTFTHLIMYYRNQEPNIDSVNHYYSLLRKVDHDQSSYSFGNIRYALLQRAWAYTSLGDYTGALDMLTDFERTKDFQHLLAQDKAWYVFNIAEGMTDINQEEYHEKALEYHKKSLSMLESIGQKKEELVFNNYYGIGRNYHALGNQTLAIEYLHKAVDYFFQTKDSSGILLTSTLLGKCYRESSDAELAEKWLTTALEFSTDYTIDDIENYGYALLENVLFYQSVNNPTKAATLAREGLENSIFGSVEDVKIDSILSPVQFVRFSALLGHLAMDEGKHSLAKRYLLPAFNALHQITPDFVNSLSKINWKEAEYELFDQLVRLEKVSGDAESLFYTIDRNKYSLLKADRGLITDVIPKLLPSESYIQYFVGKETVIAVVAQHGDFKSYELMSTDSLTNQVIRFRTEIDSNTLYNVNLAHRLYQNLVAPLQISNDNLVIVPDGILHQLPFELLITDETKKDSYFLKEATISYLLSLSLTLKENAENRRELYVSIPNFANKSKDSDATSRQAIAFDFELSDLPYAAQEKKLLSMYFDSAEFRSGSEKEGFIDAMQQYDIIHFAGHAVSIIDHPYQSLLAFGRDIRQTDQRLSLHEIESIPCQAKMVVLSACNTATGKIVEGEGAISLARGFFGSGAETVVSTLWSVNDQSTSMIMADYYRLLKEGLNKNKALTRAKINYLEQVDPAYRLPYYWAGIVLLGNTDPISPTMTRNNWFNIQNLYLSIIAVLILAVVIFIAFRPRSTD